MVTRNGNPTLLYNTLIVNGTTIEGLISGATAARPVVITSTAHGLTTGQEIVLGDIEGLTISPSIHVFQTYHVGQTTTNTFQLLKVDDTNTSGSGTHTTNTGWWGRKKR